MLKYPAMYFYGHFLQWMIWLAAGIFAFQTPQPVITAPQEEEALQGEVTIVGSSAVDGFLSMETTYAYESRNADWFLIGQSDHPIQGGVLAVWDTASIADGDYQLRLRVNRRNGPAVDVVIRNLHVRNYTPLGTSNPLLEMTSIPAAGPAQLLATPTRLPGNPAQIYPTDLALYIIEAGVFVATAFVLFGLYRILRAWFRHA